MKIAKTRTTPYHPCSNAQVERYNRTLLQMVRCCVGEKQVQWDEHLNLVAIAVRSMLNRSTGFTPNFMMLGREVSTPQELFGLTGPQLADAPEYVQNLLHGLRQAHNAARDTLKDQQRRQKQLYDRKLREQHFSTGDLVYLHDTSTKVGQSTKLRPIYIGPFLVIEVISPILYKIEGRKWKKVIHHDRLRICDDRNIPVWIRRRRNQFLRVEDHHNESVLPQPQPQNRRPEKVPKPAAAEPEDFGLLQLFDPVTTRSGRSVKMPGRFQDFVLDH